MVEEEVLAVAAAAVVEDAVAAVAVAAAVVAAVVAVAVEEAVEVRLAQAATEEVPAAVVQDELPRMAADRTTLEVPGRPTLRVLGPPEV